MPARLRLWRNYLVAAAGVAIATLARAALDPLVGDGLPFITYFAAVGFAAWHGGLGPAVFSIVASYLAADWLFISPRHTLSVVHGDFGDVAGTLVFIISSGMIVLFAENSRRARRAAERERQQVEVTLMSVGDAVISTDASGRVTAMNRVAEILTGWRAAEARGRRLSDVFRIVNEHTRQALEDPCEKVLKSGKIVALANHAVLIARDGSEVPIDDSAAPIVDATRNTLGVVLVFRNATQQRGAQEALQRIAAIVHASEDAIIGKTADGIITTWNPSAERLYGYSATEAIGQHINLIVPPAKREELADIMHRLRAGEHIEQLDTVRRRKDGSLVDVSLSISPIRNAQNEVVGASKIARDITARKRSEEGLAFLADASARLASLVDQQSALHAAAVTCVPFLADWCAVFFIDEQGQIQRRAAVHRSPDKQQLLDAMLDRHPLRWESCGLIVRALQTGSAQIMADVNKSLAGTILEGDEAVRSEDMKPCSIIAVPLRIRGRIAGAMWLVTSESGRRYTPRDAQLAAELAGRVAIALENAQLLRSVQEADRRKDEFLAMLAHELRNPLAAIQYASALGQIPSGEPGEAFELIDRQVRNLSRLIDDLLDVSRITREKIQLKKQQIDAGTIVRRAAAVTRSIMDAKGHELSVDVAGDDIPLFVDPTRVEQIIVNLLTNAAKFTPSGGRISVHVHRAGSEAVFRVADTGVGIPPEMLSRVFDLFTQADRTLDRSEGGLGIGLTVVRRLAEMHGGTVSAASEGLGRGSEFTVRLPITEAHEAPLGDDRLSALSAAKRRILVVDDNRDTAKTASQLLKVSGHEVQEAYDGKQALDVARAFRPEVLLVDLGLPQLNGYEVARILRGEGFTNETMIAVSGYGQADDRKRSKEAGFDEHLVKPVDYQALLAAISRSRNTDGR